MSLNNNCTKWAELLLNNRIYRYCRRVAYQGRHSEPQWAHQSTKNICNDVLNLIHNEFPNVCYALLSS